MKQTCDGWSKEKDPGNGNAREQPPSHPVSAPSPRLAGHGPLKSKFLALTLEARFLSLLAVSCGFLSLSSAQPALEKLEKKAVQGLPAGITGLAYDGTVLWACTYTRPGGALVKIDLQSLKAEQTPIAFSGTGSPGAMAFDGKLLWLSASYGSGIWSVDPASGNVVKTKKVIQKPDSRASQSYAGLAFDGNKLWVAWHWSNYDPAVPSQFLLRFDPKKMDFEDARFELPEGDRQDGTHALAWDGKHLWHAKAQSDGSPRRRWLVGGHPDLGRAKAQTDGAVLSQISPETGTSIQAFPLKGIARPSGMTWFDNALWIAEFDGTLWRLPMKKK